MKSCPRCGREFKGDTCPSCGAKLLKKTGWISPLKKILIVTGVIAVLILFGVGLTFAIYTYANREVPHDHVFENWEVEVPSTCQKLGKEIGTCNQCDETQERELTEYAEHKYDAWRLSADLHWKVCSVCGNLSEKDQHVYTDGYCECKTPSADTEGLKFELNSDGTGYMVTGMGTATDTVVRIPGTYNKLPVVTIQRTNESVIFSLDVTAVIIPESMTSIGSYAFNGCSSITSIVIPNSVTEIGNYSFYNCRGLTELDIPSSVTTIGENAFRYCNMRTLVIPDSVKYIGESAFSACEKMTSVTFGSGVNEIGRYAFASCRSLKRLDIPGNLYIIGTGAFNNCTALEEVVIEHGLNEIKEYTFEDCINLKSIEIPNSVTKIGGSAFYDCKKLESITIPNSVWGIQFNAFVGCESLTSATFINPVGWSLLEPSKNSNSDSMGKIVKSLSRQELSDPATAAQYLKSRYSNYNWDRS